MTFEHYIKFTLPRLSEIYELRTRMLHFYDPGRGDDTESGHICEDAMMEEAFELIKELTDNVLVKEVCTLALTARDKDIGRWYS